MTPKERMAIPPQTMPEQDAKERARNMNEVALGYTPEMAKCEDHQPLYLYHATDRHVWQL